MQVFNLIGRMSKSKFPTDKTDRAIDAGATIVSIVPWIGGPVSSVLSGYGQARKLNRIQEVLDGLGEQLRRFESTVTEEYVRTEEFEELLEQTLRRAADERQEEVRALYRRFLHRAITEPGDDYDEQMGVLRVIERLRAPHVVILKATQQEPGPDSHRKMMGSPIQTLRERTGMDQDPIIAAVGELNALGLTRNANLMVMMTGHGSENLGHMITPLGKRVLDYIVGV